MLRRCFLEVSSAYFVYACGTSKKHSLPKTKTSGLKVKVKAYITGFFVLLFKKILTIPQN